MALAQFSTINFECYDGGTDRLVGLTSVELPELSLKTTEIAGAGILGDYDAPLRGHMENLQVTLNFRVLFENATRFLNQSAQNLTLRAANETYDSGTGQRKASALKIVLRGLTQSCKLGEIKSGESSETAVVINVAYLKIEQDGKELYEFDRFNYIYNVSGVDFLTDVRDALGL